MPTSPDYRDSGLEFPADFVFGAATASYQIEGAVREDGRGPSIWDTFSHTPGKVWNGDTGDVADDHYHRLDADLDLMKQLGLEAYRFSIAWPRIQPTGSGAANLKGLDFYSRLVDGLIARGIRPIATLYHWDLPQALEDVGGWTNRDTSYRFAEYAAITAEALGDRVDTWTTLNEPWCSAYLGYGSGAHAPGVTSGRAALAAVHHLNLAHGLADPGAAPGGDQRSRHVGHAQPPRHPRRRPTTSAEAMRRIDALANRAFTGPMLRGRLPGRPARGHRGGHRLVVRARRRPRGDPPADRRARRQLLLDGHGEDVGRPVAARERRRPQGRGRIAVAGQRERRVRRSSRGRTPTWAGTSRRTGSKTCWSTCRSSSPSSRSWSPRTGRRSRMRWSTGRVHDVERTDYLVRHFAAAHRAMQRGVDLRGYQVWSLFDNFEWGYGYSKRFGIVRVDYETQERILKDSARWYSELIATRTLPPSPVESPTSA